MPNTLAHLGVQVLATRGIVRGASVGWIAAGCVIPDLPWILQRGVMAMAPQVDRLDLRVYVIAQSSLFVTLLLCGAVAALGRPAGPVFTILSLNALLHLALDALETKWANGVHLFAPYSWELWNAGLFWPESWIVRALTALGLGVGMLALWREPLGRPAFALTSRRVAVATLLVLAWAAAPLAFMGAVERSNSHHVATLREVTHRAGRPIELDRPWLDREGTAAGLRLFTGERLRIRGVVEAAPGSVSVRGRFVEQQAIEVLELHPHAAGRDLASYAGLALAAVLFLRRR